MKQRGVKEDPVPAPTKLVGCTLKRGDLESQMLDESV